MANDEGVYVHRKNALVRGCSEFASVANVGKIWTIAIFLFTVFKDITLAPLFGKEKEGEDVRVNIRVKLDFYQLPGAGIQPTKKRTSLQLFIR